MSDKPDPMPTEKPAPPTEGEFKAFVRRVLSVPKSEAERSGDERRDRKQEDRG